MTSPDVVVVGSGPGGRAAAVTCARAGLSVQVLEAEATWGGGVRTRVDDTHPGLRHDVCSAVHPLALASPFFRAFDLRARGVDLRAPEISFAHPVQDGNAPRAGLAYRSLDRTLEELDGPDATTWRRSFGALAPHADDVVRLALGDRRNLLLRPDAARVGAAAHLGLRMLGYRLGAGGARGARRDTPRDARAHDRTARAMFAGLAAHVIGPMPSLAGAGTALVLGTLAHAGGWPVAVGGSQVVADALMADLQAHGAHLRVETRVRRAGDLPPARAYVLDTSAHAAGQILGEGLGARTRAALGRVRYGDGAAKVDFVLRGPVPWAVPDVGRAATVHLGGTSAQIAHAEAEVAAGRHGEHPVVLVADPCVGDPDREVGGLRPLWTYAHVPAGSDRDMTAQVQAQIERFAPGFGDLVVSTRCVTAARMADHNANYVGGDISAGAVTAWQMLARPRLSLDPAYVGRMRTVVGGGPGATTTGVYLCSAAAAPGPGVHGMGGWHAARSLLAREFGLPTPALGPARARSGRVV